MCEGTEDGVASRAHSVNQLYAALIKDSGYSVDYTAKYGFGATLLNLGVYGLFIVLYYTVIGATWNAATIGVTVRGPDLLARALVR